MSATFDSSTPPPPPPKSAQQQSNRCNIPQSSFSGPPLPPPPPVPHTSEQNFATSSETLPPSPEDFWLPEILLSKLTSQLQALLSDPTLLSALLNVPSTTHPALLPSPLPPHLEATQNLASHLTTHYAHLLSLRASTQSYLLQLRALERQWRSKQALMDSALAPWSPKALYQRLGQSITENEGICEALEESFLEGGDGGYGDGRVGERELAEFVKRYREGRKAVWKMREGRARWDEGRVGGWR